MPETLHTTERQELAIAVSRVRSECLLVAWSLKTMVTGANPPETKSLRFELYEGMGYVLEIAATELSTVHGKLNEDKAAVGG